MELTDDEVKELEAQGKVLKRIEEQYYRKCKSDCPEHVCDLCFKKYTRILYELESPCSYQVDKIQNIISTDLKEQRIKNLTKDEKDFLRSLKYSVTKDRWSDFYTIKKPY